MKAWVSPEILSNSLQIRCETVGKKFTMNPLIFDFFSVYFEVSFFIFVFICQLTYLQDLHISFYTYLGNPTERAYQRARQRADKCKGCM